MSPYQLRRTPSLALLAALASVPLLVASAGCAVADRPGDAEIMVGGEQQVRVTARSFSFTPNAITVRAGLPLRIVLRNGASTPHNLTVTAPDGRAVLDLDVDGGGEAEGMFTPAEGSYRMSCGLPGHARLGMRGTLTAEPARR